MEAKDTVMSMEEMTRANEKAHLSPFANPYQEKGVIARAQAEISFKAGIKEVVEFAEMWAGYRLTDNSKWQAKLKDWGVKACG